MFVFLAVGGSYTDEQYSRVERTRALYAVSLVLGGPCIKFRFGKPRVSFVSFIGDGFNTFVSAEVVR